MIASVILPDVTMTRGKLLLHRPQYGTPTPQATFELIIIYAQAVDKLIKGIAH